ncbi:hypothetical protein [Laribacter hongkongensis]|uniref:hypothetical protein n=1 Tax=Laribacter hongkongensis TaxID=168471 RepID=UPI0011C7BF10|nr:hypothetical protein [Laribacter hongkongensis]MCG9040563.1 hypothetical protein [Laribacter hongkongensis]MCG9067155.1 hypothetical protein [Laribacter hongkongensis]MCG9087969.1 hypothetical protein [Laribacter hongkongensis]MCG9110498.1 hypothetical protein [Laribacter hongkongensis]MCG9121412.1 hypothetical protein [Laribacter hongkongensis]
MLAENQRGGRLLTPGVRPNPAKYGLRRQKQQVQRRSLRQIAENLLSEEAEPTVGSSGSRFLEVPIKDRMEASASLCPVNGRISEVLATTLECLTRSVSRNTSSKRGAAVPSGCVLSGISKPDGLQGNEKRKYHAALYTQTNQIYTCKGVYFTLCNTQGMHMIKSDMVESIKAILIGAIDLSGNKVINVLAKYNEYVIYEIETDDINNRIKVFIDGRSDESETSIQKRFNSVKQKYIEAKGMLAKSTNFEMMKHRVAHTLSSALMSDDVDGKKGLTT